MALPMSQSFPKILCLPSKHPHYSLALFPSLVRTGMNERMNELHLSVRAFSYTVANCGH